MVGDLADQGDWEALLRGSGEPEGHQNENRGKGEMDWSKGRDVKNNPRKAQAGLDRVFNMHETNSAAD